MGERGPKRFDLSRFFEDTDARLRRLERRSSPVDSSTGSGLTAEDVRDITQEQLVAGNNVDLVVDDIRNTITINSAGGVGGAIFTAPVSALAWDVPVTASRVRFDMRGPGGGAGSGRKGAPGTARRAGQPGGVGGHSVMEFDTAALPSTIYLWIGSRGIGGAAQTVNSTNGLAGTAGGDTFVGTDPLAGVSSAIVWAGGGKSGAGGTTTSINTVGVAGGTDPADSTSQASYSGNGGQGGDTPSTNIPGLGTQSRMTSPSSAGSSLGGLITSNTAVGANGRDASTAGAIIAGAIAPLGGAGGGSGVASGSGNAGRGGHGIYGGGGGAGGAATDGVGNSGAGGNGGDGYILITWW